VINQKHSLQQVREIRANSILKVTSLGFSQQMSLAPSSQVGFSSAPFAYRLSPNSFPSINLHSYSPRSAHFRTSLNGTAVAIDCGEEINWKGLSAVCRENSSRKSERDENMTSLSQ
jgi:hypothetical protein